MKKQVYKLGLVAFLGLSAMTFAQVQDGVVGINTESPNATLDVVTKTGATKSLRVENTSAVETVTVLDDGKVGISATNPKVGLAVGNPNVGLDYVQDQGLFLVNKATSVLALGVRSDGAVEISSDHNANFSSSTGRFEGIAFKTSGEERMRLSEAGNVGIGTETPSVKLEVTGSIKSSDLAGSGTRNVVADESGKLVVGEAISAGGGENSAIYRNARKDDGTSINISDTDFFIHLTNQNGGTINVPAATTANNGRELCFFNSGSKGFATGAEGNGASVQPSAGTCIISVAGQWVTKNSY